MKMSKVYVVLILAGLATGVGAQSSTLQATVGDADRDCLQAERGCFQIAQAGGSENDQGMKPGSQGGPRMGPPPEAIAACKGKTSGTVCSFTGPQNEKVTGTCFAPPADRSDLPLACRPDRGGPGGPGMRPGGSENDQGMGPDR